jgi:hypothetical protein
VGVVAEDELLGFKVEQLGTLEKYANWFLLDLLVEL